MPAKKLLILDHTAIARKIRRMAYEIVEDCYDERELILVGIEPNGFHLARMLKSEIEKIQHQKVEMHSIKMDKLHPAAESIKTSFEKTDRFKDKTIIVVDDVGNTGKTLFYALSVFTPLHPKKIKTAVLVERQHKLFPVASDFVGLSLSTTLQENIRVTFDGKKGEAFLE
jgi:pyrimidine operon attenuation protein/uracil phosphoribosyltransferase